MGTEHPSREFAPPRRWWTALGLLAAAAVGGLLLVASPSDEGDELGIDVFVQASPGAVRRLAPEERPRSGDRVQLGFRAPGFARVSLFVLERGCEVAMLSGGWPVNQLEGLLPDPWTVAGDGGRLYAVFSAEPVTVPDFVEVLRRTEHGCDPTRAPPLDGVRFSARGVALVPLEAQ